MGGYIDSFKGSLRTLIGWRKRDSATLPAQGQTEKALPDPQLLNDGSKSPVVQASVPVADAADLQVSKAAKADGASMSTAAVTPQVAVKESKFRSLMAHLLTVVTFGLHEAIVYAAPGEVLAQALFPEYAGLEKAAQVKIVQVATLLQNASISAQQKYAAAKASGETNAAKLADVLTTVEQPALSLLADAGVSADTTRITNAIEATVAVMKTNNVPVTTAAG